MLRFDFDVIDADYYIDVVRDNNLYDKIIGNISRSIQGSHYLFSPEECVCLSIEEMIIIADKMKEMENARTKAD